MIYIGKTLITGSLLASLVLGGAAYLQNDTLADSTDTSSKATNLPVSDKIKKVAGDKIEEGGSKMGHGKENRTDTATKDISEVELIQKLIDNMTESQK
ncbi:hypothetical protein MNQ98_03700 [Paenibacillus sp. N3/727]|uniref:hypothetical protein n=1 Tax=Paenibacillus sp. N3/727 TaxID=2925845 RepID=UPI001F53B3B6|nr:hypothetical protein [Paenibacillus sp. N3/727]UNK19154.1 hypothetical protein MNQ98_03700 [Paenibacillus sp. N3/727]